MDRLEKEINQLITMLETSSVVEKFLKSKQKVLEDFQLIEKIHLYQQKQEESYKEEIEKNSLYQNYLENERNFRLLLLGIHIRFQKLKEKRACGLSKENIKEE